jgi:CRISPR type III-B/RAMP module RAMP protein Cmr6
MPDRSSADVASGWSPVGSLASIGSARTGLPAPDDPRCRAANALLILHRSAVLAVDNQGTVKLDDDWMRSWARATRLGQGPPSAPSDLAEKVAARRLAALTSLSADVGTSMRTIELEPMAALVTGTGAGGIRDVGIELHGTYGWPVLPGSTLKGVAHAFARDDDGTPDDSAAADEEIAAIFGAPPSEDGHPGRAGAVTFLDALPGPGGIMVTEHVLTPHTRGYQLDPDEEGDAGRIPPAEYINPVPIPFLALSGGSFLIHLIGPEPEVDRAADLLERAVHEIGLGAKTTSGYGYLKNKGSHR